MSVVNKAMTQMIKLYTCTYMLKLIMVSTYANKKVIQTMNNETTERNDPDSVSIEEMDFTHLQPRRFLTVLTYHVFLILTTFINREIDDRSSVYVIMCISFQPA